jgi:hypothetical protein
MFTLEVIMGWSDPSCTTLVPGTRSVMGMVTAKVRHVFWSMSGYGHGVVWALPLTTTFSIVGIGLNTLVKLNRTRTAVA